MNLAALASTLRKAWPFVKAASTLETSGPGGALNSSTDARHWPMPVTRVRRRGRIGLVQEVRRAAGDIRWQMPWTRP